MTLDELKARILPAAPTVAARLEDPGAILRALSQVLLGRPDGGVNEIGFALDQPGGHERVAIVETVLNLPPTGGQTPATGQTPPGATAAPNTTPPSSPAADEAGAGEVDPAITNSQADPKSQEPATSVAPATAPDAADPDLAALQAEIAPVAPALAALLTGPASATALHALSVAVCGDSKADAKAILGVLAVDPSEAKVKEAEASAFRELASLAGGADSANDRKLASEDLAKRLEARSASQTRDDTDRKAARDRQRSAQDYWVNPVLAIVVTLGFFWVLDSVMTTKSWDPPEVAYTMLGVLGTAWIAIISFYFGSSTGSKVKTKLLANQLPKEEPSANP